MKKKNFFSVLTLTGGCLNGTGRSDTSVRRVVFRFKEWETSLLLSDPDSDPIMIDPIWNKATKEKD